MILECQTLTVVPKRFNFKKGLDELNAEGWEITCVQVKSEHRWILYYERLVPAKFPTSEEGPTWTDSRTRADETTIEFEESR